MKHNNHTIFILLYNTIVYYTLLPFKMPFRLQSTPLLKFLDKLPQKSGLLSQIGILSKDLDKDMWGNICTLDIFLMGHYLEEDEFEKFQKIHDEYLHYFVYFCVNSRYYLVLADNLARTE